MNKKFKNGVFLARMQPLHKAHLHIIKVALDECEKVDIVLGSANKYDMIRNPFSLEKRKTWLLQALKDEYNFDDIERINIHEIADWSYENDTNETEEWGKYFYYNTVNFIRVRTFSIYYSDNAEIIKKWFVDETINPRITLRLLDRSSVFEGLSATKIRQAIVDNNKEYLEMYLPRCVIDDLDEIRTYYLSVLNCPKEDFAMK